MPHEVLNAEAERAGRESEIVAQAGRAFAITIATNMAGRGTDILLGGTPATCVSSFHCILLCMCPTLLCMWPAEAPMSFSAVHLLHVCPCTTVYYCMCPVYSCICVLHCVLLYMWPAEALISFSALHLYMCPRGHCIHILLYMCPHAAVYWSAY